MPGPCFAVLDVLGERGVMSLPELYDAVETKYPGVLRGKRYLKHRILLDALVNKVMRVRKLPPDGRKPPELVGKPMFKDCWALRRPGQTRMGVARK